jgi:hypothetical protein
MKTGVSITLRLLCSHILLEIRVLISSVFTVWFFFLRKNPPWARASSFTRFLDHTQRRTTLGRIPLDEWSARRRDLFLTTHNIHSRQASIPPVGFEPTISAGERAQTYALERAATKTVSKFEYSVLLSPLFSWSPSLLLQFILFGA